MIPIFELTRQYKSIETELKSAVHTVMENGYFTLGPRVKMFEDEFADYLGSYHAIGVASGTDALTLVLKAFGLMPGDEVVIPANAYPNAFGVALSGAAIRLADCGPDGNMSADDLAKRVTEKTKAVIPVHLYGNPADIIGLQNILNNAKRKIYLLEDAAQAHGAVIEGKKVGTLGDAAIFSFYPSKNLGAMGDGGMIVTDSSSLAGRVKMLRQYGEKARYQSEVVSGVSRLDELQAAILSIKLRHLDAWNRRRKEIASFYDRELSNIGDLSPFTFHLSPSSKSSHHLYVVRTKKRDKLMKHLLDHGVGCAVHYPVPVHLTKAFAYLGYKKGDFPESEAQSREVLSLPLFPELTDSETETVVKTVRKFFQ